MNNRGQQVLYKTEEKSPNHPFAKVWRLRCVHCGSEYNANSCDAHIKKCPICQEGK